MGKVKKQLSCLLAAVMLCLISLTALSFSEQQAQQQIQSILQNTPPGQPPSSAQRQQLQQNLQQWFEHLPSQQLNNNNISFASFETAMQAWQRWSSSVNSLGFAEQFPQAEHLAPNKLMKLIPALAEKMHQHCTQQHQLKQLKKMMDLLTLMTHFQLEKEINTAQLREKIESCGQFELEFQSHIIWPHKAKFNMAVSAKVPFKIQFNQTETLGSGTLHYDHFSIDDTGDCRLVVTGKSNGTIEIADFQFINQQYQINLILKPLTEYWKFAASCEEQLPGYSNNFLSSLYQFHKDKLKQPNNLFKGFLFQLQPGTRSNIASKTFNQSFIPVNATKPMREKTTIKVRHKPAQN